MLYEVITGGDRQEKDEGPDERIVALVGGITLDPGVYSFTVEYSDASGMIVDRLRFENVEARPNRITSYNVCYTKLLRSRGGGGGNL